MSLLCILLKQNNVAALCIEVFTMGLSCERGDIGCFIVQLQPQEHHCDPILNFCQTLRALCRDSARNCHVAKMRIKQVQCIIVIGHKMLLHCFLPSPDPTALFSPTSFSVLSPHQSLSFPQTPA